MSRPEKERIVNLPPLYTEFIPVGNLSSKNMSVLSLDEYEAFRLADYMGLSHEEASREMEISRATFTRLIEKARKKIASLIIEGKGLNVEGGNIHFRKNIIKCSDCGQMFKIKINHNIDECPACESTNVFNLAGSFGHGKCCYDDITDGG